jgi:hypothetical protein
MKTITQSYLIATALFLFALATQAQTYSLSWDVIAGGGGSATGGVYSVSSTIGEQVAGGSLTGGSYSLASGFWAPYSLATAGAPTLSIFLSGTNTVVVAWPAPSTGWTLQLNTDLLSGMWLTSSNTVNAVSGQNQVILAPSIGNQFYRLHSP